MIRHINDRLDCLESRAPAIPASTIRFWRAAAAGTASTATAVVRRVNDAVSDIVSAGTTAGNTALGQARSSVERSNDFVGNRAAEATGQIRSSVERSAAFVGNRVAEATGQVRSSVERSADFVGDRVSEATGQAARQASDAVEALNDEISAAIDDAAVAVDPDRPLSEMTKAELYDLAQEREIEGRSTMSKRQLVAALS